MENKKCKQLLIEYEKDPHHLLRLHMMNKITLDSHQIKKIIKLRDKQEKIKPVRYLKEKNKYKGVKHNGL